MYNNSANEMLMGGGIPAAKFDQIGVTIAGTISAPPEVQQQRDFTSGELLTWDDGNPRQQIKVILDTDQRDPADAYDDGQRALYIKSGLMKAVRTAIRAAGAKGMEVGGKLTVKYVGDGEPPKRGMNPPKQYSVVYEAPAAPGLVDANALLNGVSAAGQSAYEAASTSPQASAQPVTPPHATPAQQQAVQQATSQVMQQGATAGVSAEQAAAIAALSPEQRAALGL